MDSLIVTNKKILDFYSQNPSINFEAVNLIFVDLFEKLLNDMNSAMNSTINAQILSNVDNLKSEVHTLNTSFTSLQNDLTNSIYVRLNESKRDYIEEVKNIVQNNQSQSNEKFNSLLQNNNVQLMDKTNLLLNDIVPKSNQEYYKLLSDSLLKLQQSVNEDTKNLSQSINKQEHLSSFISSFENKTTSMLQPLFTFINASEERINQNLHTLRENSSTQISVQEQVMKDLSEFLNKYKNSSYKGQFGENQLESVLNQMFPSAEIINTTGVKASCDFRVNRMNFPTILIETKNYERNVSLDEVKKFIRDIEEQKQHGIFLSQHSGITSKQNFHIDVKNNNILVYVHHVDYNPQTIQIAIDIIDSLSQKISEFDQNNEEISLSTETMEEINKEYSNFVKRKALLIDLIKDFSKKINNEIDEIKFPSLSKFISNKCGTIFNDENETILCNICNQFEAINNKSLSAHQRGCKKKHKQAQETPILVVETKN